MDEEQERAARHRRAGVAAGRPARRRVEDLRVGTARELKRRQIKRCRCSTAAAQPLKCAEQLGTRLVRRRRPGQ